MIRPTQRILQSRLKKLVNRIPRPDIKVDDTVTFMRRLDKHEGTVQTILGRSGLAQCKVLTKHGIYFVSLKDLTKVN